MPQSLDPVNVSHYIGKEIFPIELSTLKQDDYPGRLSVITLALKGEDRWSKTWDRRRARRDVKGLDAQFLALKVGNEGHEPRNEAAGKSPWLKASEET